MASGGVAVLQSNGGCAHRLMSGNPTRRESARAELRLRNGDRNRGRAGAAMEVVVAQAMTPPEGRDCHDWCDERGLWRALAGW